MSDKVNYSIVEAESGNLAVQSTVKSFNLDHVTQKDIVDFYKSFSTYAALDTGLLPVEGSGILSIRTAGIYTQFAYQHKPGLYHVNWAAHEGGAAASYYVAQPYRIIICDMKEGNLLGARMFYSPYPITTPSQPLYHVNLPNINCRGYRGNGVGWICLYQNEDWSSLPLNERIVRFIERCSGVETYNDANMSETDGTRFYQIHKKPSHITNPIEWQEYSSVHGFEWTLDESLWIPVLVESMDNQAQHKDGGVPLTFADALVGDYQAYYYDEVHTKPINAIIRPDKTLSEKQVMSYFVASYTSATSKPTSLLDDTFNSSLKNKDKVGSTEFKGSPLLNSLFDHSQSNENEDDEDTFICHECEDQYSEGDLYTDYYGNSVCQSCFSEYIYIESLDAYFNPSDDDVVYVETADAYFHVNHDNIIYCDSCSTSYAAQKNHSVESITELQSGDWLCDECLDQAMELKGVEPTNCQICATKLYPTEIPNSSYSIPISYPVMDFTDENNVIQNFENKIVHYCTACFVRSSTLNKNFICPCGMIKVDDHDFSPCTPTKMGDSTVVAACLSCKSAPQLADDGQLEVYFQPKNVDQFHDYQDSYYSLTMIHKGVSKEQDDIF